MKVHIGIVTYNNSTDLNKLLKSLMDSDLMQHTYHIEIVNNHPTFHIEEQFQKFVTVYNTNRENHQEGHISKDYNSIIIRGFGSLATPKNDLVITIQDDNTVKPDFLQTLTELHKKYTMVTSGPGDNFVSYMPDAIRNIGLWDESLVSIGDADYLLRAVIWNQPNTSLNDHGQGRCINPSTNDAHREFWNPELRAESLLTNCASLVGNETRQENLKFLWKRVSTFSIGFSNKWGPGISEVAWDTDFVSSIRETLRPNIHQQILHPEFEKDVINIQDRY
jgi:hypothetical protein